MTERIEFKDIRHIIHVAVILLVVIAGFIIARSASVPKSFGQYGHYRGRSIEERMNLPVVFQSIQTCLDCHEEESGEVWVGSEYWQEGVHSVNACENCHSKCKEHVERMKANPDLKEFVITKDTSDKLCLTCHGILAARPKVPEPYDHKKHLEEHNMKDGQRCIECHVPHYPAI
ncbi:hypothetical protein HQ563_10650 [bacterium]|nr:hypothetical protein [bacterium]